MNTLASTIVAFIEEHHGVYMNPYFVEFGISKTTLSVDFSSVSKRDNTYLELCLCYIPTNIGELIKDLKISDIKDIDLVNAERLWELFHKGIGFIDCYLGKEINSPLLQFRYKDGRLIAMNEFEIKYAVNEQLGTSQDFINYTLRHYEKYPY